MINDGQVFQCCYLKEDFPVNHFRTDWAHDPVISKYDFYENNLKNHTLKNILNNEWFTKILPDSWKILTQRLSLVKIIVKLINMMMAI